MTILDIKCIFVEKKNMPKSRLRGGAKAHRKKVVIKSIEKKNRIAKMQEQFQQIMQEKIEELKNRNEQSGTTENI